MVAMFVSHAAVAADCSASLSHSTFGYGRIDIAGLHVTAPANLPEQVGEIGISCRTPSVLAIRLTDDRPGTVATDAGATVSQSADARIGLGMAADRRIGAYSVQLVRTSAQIDGSPAIWLKSNDDGATWAPAAGDLALQPGMLIGWARRGDSQPVPASKLGGSIRVLVAITRTSSLNMNREIDLDGAATLTIIQR
ncbi:DUF1120 domain-containing protein [Burkholderia cepacia]|uniref:DUF1120 domain-containing protein n=1 Tax=Burkholderia cepacia TaxID=292 RepID=UPI0012D8D602|nr:DUF1120 domain-containing protein [Burkholderia cepacia]